MIFYILPLLAPVLLLLAGGFALSGRSDKISLILRLCEAAGFGAFLSVLGALCVVLYNGTGGIPGFYLDGVGVTMLVLVGLVGWIVLRYARTYLLGEAQQPFFMGWMCLTLASVLVLVQSGNLILFAGAWILTSVCLHKLLTYYNGRVEAARAARKKFIISRIGEVALVIAFVALAVGYETLSIPQILEMTKGGATPVGAYWSVGFLVIAALMKSAQFPTHGWLTEVMETPTPVSALLHAGVVNAGGFLLIRFSDVLILSPGALAALVMVGGFTALYGCVVMLTQPAVKNSLAWSTIAQMGFMIMQCGLALFPLALLHIVAHSLYKAHAFLAAGMAVDGVQAVRRPGLVAVPNGRAIGRAFLLSLIIYAAIGMVFGLAGKTPQALALGAMLIFGVAYLIAQGLADTAPKALTKRTVAYSLGASISYFALQTGAQWLYQDVLPPTPDPRALEWALMVLAVFSFGFVAIAQASFPIWSLHPAAAGLRVHLANGLYVNAVFDRLIGSWRINQSTWISKLRKGGAQ